MKNLMAKPVSPTLVALSLFTDRTLMRQLALEITKYLLKTTTQCVSKENHPNGFIDPYEYAHNPELFNFTKTGKTQMMRKTAQEGGSTKDGGFLTKAGASAVGLGQ